MGTVGVFCDRGPHDPFGLAACDERAGRQPEGRSDPRLLDAGVAGYSPSTASTTTWSASSSHSW